MPMSVAKVTISIDQSLLKRIDGLVRSRVFLNRSHVIQEALEEDFAGEGPNRKERRPTTASSGRLSASLLMPQALAS